MFLPMLGSFILGIILVILAVKYQRISKKPLNIVIGIVGIVLIIFAVYLALPR